MALTNDERLAAASRTVHPEFEEDEEDRGYDPEEEREQRRLIARLRRMVDATDKAHERYGERCQEGVDFFYNRQWKDDDKDEVEDREQEALVFNEVHETISGSLGMAAMQPIDLIARPQGAGDDDVAELVSAGLKFVCEENDLDGQRLAVDKDRRTYGWGILLTGFKIRDPDPMAEPVQFKVIPPDQFRRDPNSRDPYLTDAAYCRWSRSMDLSTLKAAYADKTDEIDMAAEDEAGFEGLDGEAPVVLPHQAPIGEWKHKLDWDDTEADDEDPDGRTVMVHEIWERYDEPGWLAHMAGGARRVLDPNDAEDVTFAESDQVLWIEEISVPQVRYHVFSGDLILVSEKSPYKHRQLPFVPFWYEMDDKGDPVSQVEYMKDAQREVNHRHSLMLWHAGARSVRVSPSAMRRAKLDVAAVEKMASDPGAVWPFEKGEVESFVNNGAAVQQQFELLQWSTNTIRRLGGQTPDMQGEETNARAAAAKEIAITQGRAPEIPSENMMMRGLRHLGKVLWSLMQQAHKDEWWIHVTDDVGAVQKVGINQQAVNPMTGAPQTLNDITQANMVISIQAAPYSPTARARRAELISRILPHIQNPAIREKMSALALIDADFPRHGAFMKLVQEMSEPKTPEVPPRSPSAAIPFDRLSQEEQDQVLMRAGIQPGGERAKDRAGFVPYEVAPPDIKAQIEMQEGMVPSQFHAPPPSGSDAMGAAQIPPGWPGVPPGADAGGAPVVAPVPGPPQDEPPPWDFGPM